MKQRIIVAMCALAIILCSCSGNTPIRNDKYSIYKKDGHTYMQFHSDYTDINHQSSPMAGSISINYPQFASVSEMKQEIVSGDLSDGACYALQFSSTNGILEICDINNLYEVKAPAGFSYDSVLWYGEYYSFEYSTGNVTGHIFCCDSEKYDYFFKENFTNILNNPKRSVLTDEMISDRNAREIHYMNDVGRFKLVYYTLQSDSGVVHVLEQYELEYWGSNVIQETSDSVPQSIAILGTTSNACFMGNFRGFDSQPTIEWITAFGLEPTT